MLMHLMSTVRRAGLLRTAMPCQREQRVELLSDAGRGRAASYFCGKINILANAWGAYARKL